MKKRLGKLVCAVVSLLMICSVLPPFSSVALAEGETGETNGYSWSADSAGVTITGYNGDEIDITIPNEIEGVGTVVAIGQMAFYGRTAITRVTIPNTVTSIGLYAFGVCPKLARVSIPASVTTIEEGAFRECSNLYEIALDEANASFCLDADGVLFDAAKTRLIAYPAAKPKTSYAIPDTITAIGEGAFSAAKALETITLPDSVQSIGPSAFFGCLSLRGMTIPDGVTEIGDSMFYDCRALATLTLPDSVTRIGQSVFCRATSLTNLTLPHNLARIENYAFGGSGLTSVTIPASAGEVSDDAFSSCESLTGINVEAGNPVLSAQEGVLYKTVTMEGGPTIKMLVQYPPAKPAASFDIPDGVQWLFPGCFHYADNLTTIKIPASVGFVDPYGQGESRPEDFSPFSGLNTLSSVTLGPGTTNFLVGENDGALYSADMTYLYYYPPARTATTYELPAEVKSIRCPFLDCYTLESFTVEEGNANFIAQDGILYDISYAKADDPWVTMISYPPAKTGDTFTVERRFTDAGLGIDATLGLEVCALGNNRFLRHVTIAPGATGVGSFMFYGCINLEQVDIPDGVEMIGQVVFGGCNKLRSVTIPASVKWIEESSFLDCSGLETVIFLGGSAPTLRKSSSADSGASLEKIGNNAFAGCTSLAGIDIPDSVIEISLSAFSGCDSLAAINVGAGNGVYSSAGGVLYSKNSAELLLYPINKAGSDFTVPATVTTIGAGAFDGSRSLTRIRIPASVTSIDTFAFSADVKGHLTIIGEEGSFAEMYAAGMGIPFEKGTEEETCLVTFDSRGGSQVQSQDVPLNGKAQAPNAPTRTGYTFAGWCSNATCTTAWNFATNTVTANITLYAKWIAAAPQNPRAKSLSYNSARVAWDHSPAAPDIDGYEVWRATSATGTYSLVSTVSGSTLAIINSGLATNTAYYYKIRAYDLASSTKIFGSFSAVTAAVRPIPAAPVSCVADSASYSSIKISWGAVSGASGYEVYRAIYYSSGTYTWIATTTATSYTNTGLNTGSAYYYKVRAYRTVNGVKVYGPFSVVDGARPTLGIPPTVRAYRASSSSIKVTWGGVSGASGYELWRSTSATGSYVLVKATIAKYYTNTGLTTGKWYYYKVRAYRMMGKTKVYSAFSAYSAAKP